MHVVMMLLPISLLCVLIVLSLKFIVGIRFYVFNPLGTLPFRSTNHILSIFGMSSFISRMDEVRSAFRILTSTSTGKRLLGRPRRRWEDNIRMDLKEIGINTRNWVDSALDRNYFRSSSFIRIILKI